MNDPSREQVAPGAGAELAQLRTEKEALRRRVAELEEAQVNAQRSRLATLNVMEDVVAARSRAEEVTEALRTSEERMRLILESAKDFVIFTSDLERRVTSWNAGAQAILGYEEREILGQSGDVLFVPEDQAQGAPLREVQKAARLGRAENERWHQRKDGSRFYGSGLMQPFRDSHGATIGFVKIMRDLTRQKRDEEALRESEERQAYLLRLSDALRPLADAVAIQERASRVLGEHLSAHRVGYVEYDHEDGRLTFARHYAEGLPPITGAHFLQDFGAGLVAALKAGRTVVHPEIAREAMLTDEERAAYVPLGIGAMVDVPLVKDGRLEAILFAHHEEPRSWSKREIALMQETAERTWAAVERARAEEALRQSEAWLAAQKEAFQIAMNGEPLEASLGVLVRAAVEQSGGEGRAAFYLMQEGGATLRHVVGMPPEYARCVNGFAVGSESLACGLATHMGEPVVTPDVEAEPRWRAWLWLAREFGYRACWSFPVRTTGGPILGTLAFYFEEPRQPSRSDRQLAAVLTHAAAIIVSRQKEAEARAKAEEALRASEERLRSVLESASDFAIFTLDSKGTVTSWNRGAQTIFGYAAEEIIGKNGAVMCAPEDRAVGRLLQEIVVAENRGRAVDERWHSRKDGSLFWGSGSVVPLRVSAARRGPAYLMILSDQTVARQASEALEESKEELWQALRETESARAAAEIARQTKDQFLAVLSHELRTPLTPVLMAVRVLSRDRTISPTARESLEMIERNIRLESRFIEDLLDLTRIERGKLEISRLPLRLHEVINHAVEVVLPDLQAKGQKFEIALEAKEDLLLGDASRLQQVFWNLLKNGSKFSPANTTIRLHSRNPAVAAGEDPCIVVDVADQGIGFEAEVVERIFNPFTQASKDITREFGGLGLGLSISRASILAHGGAIEASSPGRDQGATFSVTLNLAEPERANLG